MKRFFIREKGTPRPFYPFWMPVGALGWVWRTLVFLAALFLLMLLSTLLRDCSGIPIRGGDGSTGNPDGVDDVRQPSPGLPIITDIGPVGPKDDVDPSDSGGKDAVGTDTSSPGGTPVPVEGETVTDKDETGTSGPSDPSRSGAAKTLRPGTSDEPVSGWNPNISPDRRSPNLPDESSNRKPDIRKKDSVTDPEDGVTKIDPTHLYVILDSGADDETFNRFADEFTSLYPKPEHVIEYYNVMSKTIILKVPKGKRAAIKAELPTRIKDVRFYVVNVEVLGLHKVPTDPAFSISNYSWQYAPVQATDAWDITTGKPSVKVAVVDSYFDVNHPEFDRVRIVDPYCLARGTQNVLPDESAEETPYIHGTHVAGIIFSAMDNGQGACGIAPDCSFMPVSLGPEPTNFNEIEGILYAIYKGANVINISVGGTSVDPEKVRKLSPERQVALASTLDKEVQDLWDYVFSLCEERNVTLVWAAGNENIYTAIDASKRNNTTVKVDAVDRKLGKAYFSNFGNVGSGEQNYSTISAPGVDIVNSVPTAIGSYASLGGTSMAAPIVTGAVALMKSLNPNLRNSEVIEILKSTAKPLPDDSIGDLLQIGDALRKVQEDFLSFDDLIKDHTRIIGKWEATRLFTLLSDGKPTDVSIRMYMEFTTTTSGRISLQASNGDVYEGPLKVTYGPSEVLITETAVATTKDGDRMSRSLYHCTPDKQKLLSVVSEQEGRKDDAIFNLKKIEE